MNMQFNAVGAMVGFLIFVFCLFLAQAIPIYFTSLTAGMLDLVKIGFLVMGILAIIIGGISK